MASNVTVRRLTHPTEAEWARVGEIMKASLYADKVVQCITGQSDAAERHLFSVSMTAALRDGEIWVAGFNGSIDGAALWIQPGKEEPTLDRPDYFALLSDQTRRWIVQHFSLVYRELYTTAYATGPIIRTQSWHLGFIGVLPQLQRRGLGRALVNAVIGNGDHAEYPVTVDASVLSSVYFFQSLGFMHRGVKNFTCPKGSFPLWCLMRPPTSTRGTR